MAQINLITWNIQWGRGCDGRVDLRRIVDTVRAMADFDVLCLQEVARNFRGLPGSRGEDQFRMLAELLPGYVDSWQIRHPGRPHAPTLGVFDREQWPQPFTCDYVFVTEDLAGRVREVRVDTDTDASDHQPVLISLNGN